MFMTLRFGDLLGGCLEPVGDGNWRQLNPSLNWSSLYFMVHINRIINHTICPRRGTGTDTEWDKHTGEGKRPFQLNGYKIKPVS